MKPEEFDLNCGSPPEEDPSWNVPSPNPDPSRHDPALLGLKPTPANVEALRTARAVEAFRDNLLDDEAVRLRLFMAMARVQAAERKLAQARSRPKSNPLADMLGGVADAARRGRRQLWPSVRDAMIESLRSDTPLVGDFIVKAITGKGFGDTYAKSDLAGIRITFELPDGTEKTIAAATAYNYIMA